MPSYENIRYCLCCNSSELYPYLDLGFIPPPNSFRLPTEPEPPRFPLAVNVCRQCWHSQLTVAVDPSLLFKNYLYRTGVSQMLREHYDSLAREVCDKYLASGQRVVAVDIGCNDMTLLRAFEKRGASILGVDPTNAVTALGWKYEDALVEDFWGTTRTTRELVKKLSAYDVNAAVITATNVVAHQVHPARFLYECRETLYRGVEYDTDNLMVVEFPYSLNLLANNEFDTIYHEHLSYFTVHSFLALLRGLGWFVEDVSLVRVHGGSIRFVLRVCHTGEEDKLHCPAVRNLIVTEGQSGLLNPHTYLGYQQKLYDTRFAMQDVVREAQSLGRKVIAFGASGKSTVLLNWCDIEPDYIIDETPEKQGRLTPGKNIPIKPLQTLQEETQDLLVIITVWNCLEECLSKIQAVNQHSKSIIWVCHVPTFQTNTLR